MMPEDWLELGSLIDAFMQNFLMDPIYEEFVMIWN